MKAILSSLFLIAAFIPSGMAQVYINTTPYYSNDSARKLLVNRVKYVWRNITMTSYEHINTSVIDELNGIYRFDCSGFVCEILLKNSLPDHYDDIYNYWEDHKTTIPDVDGTTFYTTRPLAGHFYDYFRDDILQSADILSASNDYWYVFQDIHELQRGDLIVARNDDEWRIAYTNKTTGHMMIAWDIGELDGSNNLTVRVFDATGSAHTPDLDTRVQNDPPTTCTNYNGEVNTGVGSGVMKFKVSTNGKYRPYQYLWSTTSTSWYTLYGGGAANRYNRLEGIILARPITTPYSVKPDPAIEANSVSDQGNGTSMVSITITTNLAASAYSVEYTDSLSPVWHDADVEPVGDTFHIAVSNSVSKRFFRLIRK